MRLRYTQSSFKDGVLSPRMHGQVELDLYKSSVATLQNFVVLPQGAVTRRPGTYFAAEVADSTQATRIIPFSFGGADSYILEMGHQYIRFYKEDGVLKEKDSSNIVQDSPYEIISPFTAAQLDEISYVQSADIIFFAHPDVAPTRLKREVKGASEAGAADDTKWSFDPPEFIDGPYDTVNSDESRTLTIAGTYTQKPLTPLEVNSAEHFLQLKNHGLLDGQEIKIAHTVTGYTRHPKNNTTYYVVNATANTFQIADGKDNNTGRPKAPVKFGKEATVNNVLTYVYTEDGTTNGTKGPDQVDATQSIIEKGGTVTATIAEDDFFDSTRDAGRLIRFNTFKGDQLYWSYGVIDEDTITDDGSNTNNKATVTLKRDLLLTGDTSEWQLGQWNATDGYPRTVTIFQQRLVYAGSEEFPQTIWFSKTADFYNFAASEPIGTATGQTTSSGARVIGEQINADNAISLIVDSDTVDQVVWLLSGRKLIMGTTGGVFNIYGSENNLSITPANFTIEKATQFPCEKFTNAALIDKSAIFIQANARRLLELDYSSGQDDSTKLAIDMTLRAEHLTRPKLKRIAFQSQPYSIIWAVMEDGTLASCTFEKLLNMYAWSSHVIGGSYSSSNAVVEDLAVIPRGSHDQLWFIVKRTINGATVRYIEYVDRYFDNGDLDEENLKTANFVDCSLLAKDLVNKFNSVSGLNHLEGELVGVHVGGGAHSKKTISGGSITLDDSVNYAVAGLPYVSDLQTLPLVQGPQGVMFGHKRRIHKLAIKYLETLGVKIGLGDIEEDYTEVLFRTSDRELGNPPELFTGEKSSPIINKSFDLGEIVVRSDGTFPTTLLALSFDYEASDV
jgi:hypothetical protein